MYRILACILTLTLFFSCREIEDKKFTIDENKYIDSMYRVKLKVVVKEMDSLCVVNKEAKFLEMTDSIKTEYIKEIEAIIE